MDNKKFEELTITDDFMFGIIMRNPKYCKPFLETVLNIRIRHIEYPEDQKTINVSLDGKGVRLDVYVEDDEHTVYNIEMQNTTGDNIYKRTRYYQSAIDLDQLDKGVSYAQLKKSLIIFVCIFDPFEEGRHIYTFENRCIEDTVIALGDETQKIFLNTKGIFDDVRPELKRLLDFIDGKQPEDAFTQDLAEAVKSVKLNEKWRISYMTLQEHYHEKYNEGFAEGRLEEIISLVQDGIISAALGAERTGMSIEEFETALAEAEYKMKRG